MPYARSLRNSMRVVVTVGILSCMLGAIPDVAKAANSSAVVGNVASRNPKVMGLLFDARSALRMNQLQKALTDLKLAVSMEPKNPLVLTELGVVLNVYGDFSRAEDTLRRARALGAPDELVLGPLFEAMLAMGNAQPVLDLFPDPGPSKHTALDATILRARASALEMLGDPTGANSAISRSLAIRPDFDGLMTAARIAFFQQDWSRAESSANEALKLSPGNADVVVFKISLALRTGEQAKALELAERLVADKPSSLAARFARIKVYLALGKTDLAKPEVDRILAEAPGTALAIYYRAIIQARHNNYAAAWGTAHALSPEIIQSDPQMAINIANMAAAAGFLESGAIILNAAVAKNPHLLDARLQLADFRLRQKSPQYALNVLAMVADSKDPRVAVLFARAHFLIGRRDEAKQDIIRAIGLGGGEALRSLGKDVALASLSDWLKLHPNDLLARRQYAVLLLGYGDLVNARIQYEQLVLTHPDDAVSLNNLSWLVLDQDPARALALARRAVKQSPLSPDFLDTLGCMQLKQSDTKGALQSLQLAHRLKPEDPEIAYHLVLALDANGSRGAAKSLLIKIVAQGGFADLASAKRLLRLWT